MMQSKAGKRHESNLNLLNGKKMGMNGRKEKIADC
jgi:hypothetical protein